MKLQEFYADKRRRISAEVPLAEDWTSRMDPDATYKLFWIIETGEVCALRIGPVAIGPGLPKPYLVDLPKTATVGREDQEISILGSCTRLPEVRGLVEHAEQTTIESLRGELAQLG